MEVDEIQILGHNKNLSQLLGLEISPYLAKSGLGLGRSPSTCRRFDLIIMLEIYNKES